MKSKKIYTKLLLAGSLLLMGGTFTSCDDYLTILPTDQLPEENFWKDKSDLDNVRAGAYEQLTQGGQTSKILIWGELRGDNLAQNDMSNANIQYLQDAILQPNVGFYDWSGFYTGINFCNLIMEKGADMTVPGKEVDPSFSRSDFQTVRAEMLALRSLYYFYLVRAYRDVPYVTSSVRSDAQAIASRPAATPGVAILGECIDSLEATMPYAVENYGSNADNKGRFTRLSAHALLADMYLWRACMLRNYVSKNKNSEMSRDPRVNMTDVVDENGNVKTADGRDMTDAVCNAYATECYNKAIEHCDYVINKMKADYDKRVKLDPSRYTEDEVKQPYPLYQPTVMGDHVTDVAYNKIFGTQNSYESILELQYDGSTTINSTVNGYLSSYSNGEFKPALMALNQSMVANAASVNPETGFGRTDLRLWNTCQYNSAEVKKPITKFVVENVSATPVTNLSSSEAEASFNARTSSSNNAHWPVYRLADVMTIKAECIARLGNNDNKYLLREGYRLVNQIFKRNNPALVDGVIKTSDDDQLICDRVSDTYGNTSASDTTFTKNASDLLKLVYQERQREFVAEGKRWFDIVRQAEYTNDTKTTLSTYASVKSSVKTRLAKLWGFYLPYYSEELKVNGADKGGSLYQNPVWDRYSKK